MLGAGPGMLHGGPVLGGCGGALHTGLLLGPAQQEVSGLE